MGLELDDVKPVPGTIQNDSMMSEILLIPSWKRTGNEICLHFKNC